MAKVIKNLYKNFANIITLVRVILIFFVLALLMQNESRIRIWGVILLTLAFLLDGLDGIVAKKTKVINNIGALIDTLGDRITENMLFVFLAYKRVIPLLVPLIFICRSFIADFIRFIAFNHGVGTFEINNSKLGRFLVASRLSRIAYLMLKFFIFLGGALIIYADSTISGKTNLSSIIAVTAIVVTIFSIARFILLLFDSRLYLEEIFLER